VTLWHAQAVRAADLEQALLVLPFADALRLFEHVLFWLRDGSQARHLLPPAARCCGCALLRHCNAGRLL